MDTYMMMTRVDSSCARYVLTETASPLARDVSRAACRREISTSPASSRATVKR